MISAHSFVITPRQSGVMDSRFPLGDVPPPPPPPVDDTITSYAGLAGLASGYWAVFDNSHFEDVEKKPDAYDDWNGVSSSKYNSVQAVGGLSALTDEWSGGCFASNRNSILVFGGGHSGYYGNEVYEFRLDTVDWARLTDPYPFPDFTGNPAANPDGTPVSRHTYDGLAWDSYRQLMYSYGGSKSNSGYAGNDFFKFDPATGVWTQLANAPAGGYANNLVYVPSTDKVYAFKQTTAEGVYEYDPVTDGWVTKSAIGPGDGYPVGTLVDSVSEIWFAQRNGSHADGTLRRYNYVTNTWYSTTPTGDAPATKNAPGFCWSEELNKAIWYGGGVDVYTLDTSYVWAKHAPAAGNNLTPYNPTNAADAPYGRFQLISSDLVVYIPKMNTDVYVRRL